MDDCIREILAGTTLTARASLRSVIAEVLNVWDTQEALCVVHAAPCHTVVDLKRLRALSEALNHETSSADVDWTPLADVLEAMNPPRASRGGGNRTRILRDESEQDSNHSRGV